MIRQKNFALVSSTSCWTNQVSHLNNVSRSSNSSKTILWILSLFNIPSLSGFLSEHSAETDLWRQCLNLQRVLTKKGDESNAEETDIDGIGLYDELRTLSNISPWCHVAARCTTRYMHKNQLHEVLSNLSITLRILLTIPVTGERSFSRLKLIKTYLRSTIWHKRSRLVGLSFLSIQHDIAQALGFSALFKTFANAKARKVAFC